MRSDSLDQGAPIASEMRGRADDSKYISQVRSNVKSELIEITEDKLKIILLEHVDNIAVRTSWVTPLTLFATVLLTELTTTFKDKFGLTASAWEAVFLVAGIAALVWLVATLARLRMRWGASSIESVIAIIKNVK